ncbi:MAG TPA: hypothetical protein DD490_03920 [Acidobacteria bacterium]|nr:hypothetical protein [Acidobacteriota bacterium]
MSETTLSRPVTAKVDNEFKFSSKDPSAYGIEGRLEVFKNGELVHVGWNLPLPYAIRDYPHTEEKIRKDRTGFAITLFEKDQMIKSIRSTDRQGTWSTGESWAGGGWWAQLAVWNDHGAKEPGWVVHIRTPMTPAHDSAG